MSNFKTPPPPPYQVLRNEGNGSVTQFRVYVSVNNEMFLVGVPNPRFKVSWLAKNVAERYYRETGIMVSLRIRERTGAKLSHDDVIGVVVGNGDHLSAERGRGSSTMTEASTSSCEPLTTCGSHQSIWLLWISKDLSRYERNVFKLIFSHFFLGSHDLP